MLILGIDTSAAPCCAAVYDTEKQLVVCETVINNKLTHSVTLMPVISDMLKNAELDMSCIDLYAVTSGPGSFTGLRIGISAVKGMAFANSKPCAAVTAGEAMAYNLTACDCVVCSCIDARCAQVYNALFRVSGGRVEALCEERCIKADELVKCLAEYPDEDIILTGDAAQLVQKEADGAGLGNVRTAPAPLRYQTGHGVCMAAEYAEHIKPEALMPMYLKLPQAQRELMAKQEADKKS